MRSTSLQAYDEICQDGAIGRAQAITLRCLRATPNVTARQLQELHPEVKLAMWKRLKELEGRNLAARLPAIRDPETGRPADVWRPV